MPRCNVRSMKKRRKKYIYIPKSYRKLTKDEMEIFNKKEPEKKDSSD